MEPTFSGKQLILNEINTICTDKKGIGMVTLLSRFDHFHFLDGVKYVNQLQEEKRIILTEGVIYSRPVIGDTQNLEVNDWGS